MGCPYCGRDYSGTSASCSYCREGFVSLSTDDPQAIAMLRNQQAEIDTLCARVAELEAIVKAGEIPLPKTASSGAPPMRAEDVLRDIVCGLGDMARRGRLNVALWSEVGQLTSHGSGYSSAICRWAGVDPNTSAALTAEEE